MTRRDLLRLMLATAAAEAVDFEQLLWVPKPIVTVPAMPKYKYSMGILRKGLIDIPIVFAEDRVRYWIGTPDKNYKDGD